MTASNSSNSVFTGQTVSPGVSCGLAFTSFAGLSDVGDHRLSDEELSSELGRLDSVARAARVSLVRQREALSSQFTPEQLAVFNTHLQLLEDPVIEADVKERITEQRMTLENAVKDVFHVYERLFEVVQTQSLRNKMSDMRDVALRYLRHCKRSTPATSERPSDMKDGVLIVKELTLSDLTEALEHGISAIAAEVGSADSHGAILTQAAGIPAVIGVDGIRDVLVEGQTVLVDGNNGQVIIDPSPEAIKDAQNRALEEETPSLSQPVLADGSRVRLSSAVASAREAKTAARIGISDVGLYRSELPVIQRQGDPKEASLAVLYKQLCASSEQMVFRLPDLDSSVDLPSVYAETEANPAMGLRGVRLLFSKPQMLNKQLRAIYRASEGKQVRIAVPFVTGPSDVKRVRENLASVREELRLAGVDVSAQLEVGAVIETPASALVGREVITEADFVLIAVDGLSQYMLACERDNHQPEVRSRINQVDPVTLRAVRKLCTIADALNKPISIYGESLAQDNNLELMVAAGVRSFALRPGLLAEAQERLEGLDLSEAESAFVAAISC